MLNYKRAHYLEEVMYCELEKSNDLNIVQKITLIIKINKKNIYNFFLTTKPYPVVNLCFLLVKPVEQ